MGSRQVKNFKHAVNLVITDPDLGCPLINEYYASPSENVKKYITFLKCNYCYKHCPMEFSECVDAIRYLYYNGLMSINEFRTVLGRFLALKRKGLLS